MEILYIVASLVLLFIIWTAIGTVKKMGAANKVAGALSLQAQ